MSFNLISLAVLFIAAIIITFEIIRSFSRGVKKSLVTLASVFIAMFSSIAITFFLVDWIVKSPLIDILKRIKALDIIFERFPHIGDVIFAYADAILSPLVFVIVFILLRVIIGIVFAIVFKRQARQNGNKVYENEDAPQYKKKPRPTCAILGTLSGVFVSIIVFTPIMGTLRIASTAAYSINESDSAFNFKINSKLVRTLDKFSNDAVGTVLFYSGGALVYQSTSTSRLNDNHFELSNEIEETFDGVDDVLNVGIFVSKIDKASAEQKESLKHVGNQVNDSETLKCLAADIIPDISRKWLKGMPYYNVERPKVGRASAMFFDKMLYVCTSSTPDTVGADLNTLLNVYLIAYEYGVLNCHDYDEMIDIATETGVFDKMKEELNKNRRMAGIGLEIDTMSVRVVSSVIYSLDPEDYKGVTEEITGMLNDALDLSKEERVDFITDEAEKYINQYDVDIDDALAKELAEEFSNKLLDTDTELTVEDVEKFWEDYTLTKNESVKVEVPDSGKIEDFLENEGADILEDINNQLAEKNVG